MERGSLKLPRSTWFDLYRQVIRSIDVYCVPLSLIEDGEEEMLSAYELEVAGRKRFEISRSAYRKAHAIMRSILAEYCSVSPASLQFERSRRGKPYLVTDPMVHFSLSHSETHVALAVAPHDVGIDIEIVTPVAEYKSIADRYFTKREQQTIRAAAAPLHIFFETWVAKEAAMKCLDVSIDVLNDRSTGPPSAWLSMPQGMVGAVVWQ
jgi:4'-phosphopantetheinyl transferase